MDEKHLPRQATGFHFIGKRYVITPNVKLPFSQAENAAQNVAGVDSDSHINVAASRFPYKSAIKNFQTKIVGEWKPNLN